MPGLAYIILALVVVQRGAELVLAERNRRRLLAAGGVEAGARHYPFFVLLHGAWLVALFAFVPGDAPVSWPWLAVFVVLQAGRVWVISSLGLFWTTRIITLPGAPLVRSGPYRYLRHPNYLVVAGEIAVLPLVFGAWWIAALFSVLNAVLLWHRIGVEDGALAGRRGVTVSETEGP
jgi:methyltransferase